MPKPKKRKTQSPTSAAVSLTPRRLTVATADRGVARGLLSALGPSFEIKGLDVQLVPASGPDELTDIIIDGRADVVILPDDAVGRLAALGLIRPIDDAIEQLGNATIGLRGHGDTVIGVSVPQLGSVAAIPGRLGTLPPGLIELLIALGAFFGGPGTNVPMAAPKNSLEWEIAGPDSLSSKDIDCKPQTFQIQYTAINAKIVHIIWSKAPPPNTPAVPRSALDDKGDAPDGKAPSTASLDRATWNVPLCSVGKYKMTVTVQWLCILTNVITTETKTKEITVNP